MEFAEIKQRVKAKPKTISHMEKTCTEMQSRVNYLKYKTNRLVKNQEKGKGKGAGYLVGLKIQQVWGTRTITRIIPLKRLDIKILTRGYILMTREGNGALRG